MTTPASPSSAPRVPMDPKMRERWVDVRRAQGRRRLTIVLVVLAVIGLVLIAWLTTRTPLLDVDHIDMSGNSHIDDAAVRELAGVRRGAPLFDFDTEAAVRRLEAAPWIDTASVEREWPGRVRITISERIAAAILHNGNQVAVVDRQGRVLEILETAPAGLVRLTGVAESPAPGRVVDEASQQLLDVRNALPVQANARVMEIRRESDETISLVLSPRGTVLFGTPEDVSEKMIALAAMLERADLTNVLTIDLRVPRAPVLTRA